jgi:hypothetical protein
MHSDDPHPLLDDGENNEQPLATTFGSLRLHDDVSISHCNLNDLLLNIRPIYRELRGSTGQLAA